jgi:hypothetical protein
MNQQVTDSSGRKGKAVFVKTIGVFSLLGACTLVVFSCIALFGNHGVLSLMLFSAGAYMFLIYLEAFSFFIVSGHTKALVGIQMLPLIVALILFLETFDEVSLIYMTFYILATSFFWCVLHLQHYLKKSDMSFLENLKDYLNIFLLTLSVAYSIFAYVLHRFLEGMAGFGTSYQSPYERFAGYLFYIILLLPLIYLPLLFLVSLSKFKTSKIRCYIFLAIQITFAIILMITYFHAVTISESYPYERTIIFISGFFVLFTCLFWGVLRIITCLNNRIKKDSTRV